MLKFVIFLYFRCVVCFNWTDLDVLVSWCSFNDSGESSFRLAVQAVMMSRNVRLLTKQSVSFGSSMFDSLFMAELEEFRCICGRYFIWGYLLMILHVRFDEFDKFRSGNQTIVFLVTRSEYVFHDFV